MAVGTKVSAHYKFNSKSVTKNIQDLLNQQAYASDSGDQESLKSLEIMIKLARGETAPACWHHDDCSTSILSQCPWRIDC